jgi:hypothetical protein
MYSVFLIEKVKSENVNLGSGILANYCGLLQNYYLYLQGNRAVKPYKPEN